MKKAFKFKNFGISFMYFISFMSSCKNPLSATN